MCHNGTSSRVDIMSKGKGEANKFALNILHFTHYPMIMYSKV
uniref:Protease Do-like 9 n=1 Tax=Rhizophora mucronata TaxID=61149 RepID=A0A2P2JFJ1_RHIMU